MRIDRPAPRLLLVNTDTAAGDALALMLALADPRVRLVALAINCGNVGFDQEVENALYALEAGGAGGRVPVYAGCREPLVGRLRSVPEVWGTDGMGNARFPRARQRPEARHAVDAIIELSRAHAGRLEILSLSPLTNVAVALTREPAVARQVRGIYAMSGCLHAHGNVTLGAEFNAWVDPEALRIVLRSGAPLTLLPWEVAMAGATVTAAEEAVVQRLATPVSRFYARAFRVMQTYARSRGRPGPVHADLLAMLMVLDPRVVTERRRMYVDVELGGELSRGMTLFDWMGTRSPNADVVTRVDRARVLAALRALALSLIHI